MENKKFNLYGIILSAVIGIMIIFNGFFIHEQYAANQERIAAEKVAFEKESKVLRGKTKEAHLYVQGQNKELQNYKDKFDKKVKTFKKDYSGYISKKQNKRLGTMQKNMKNATNLKECKRINKNFKKLEKNVENARAEAEAIAAQEAASYSYSDNSGGSYSGGNSFESQGVVYSGGTRYTYYSSNVLYHYRTGEWNAGNDGFYRDDNGYLVVASSDHSQGSVVNTPWGPGKVYDSGCASGTIDMYTNF